MPIVKDTKEKDDEIKVEDEGHLAHDHDAQQSFDYLIKCHDGHIYRVERKTWNDFVQSWKKGRLERQLENVSLLIVEKDEDWEEAFIVPEEITEFSEDQRTLHQNARKHLASISANMWVIETSGEEETLSIMRYIEERGGDMNVRQNNVSYRAKNARTAMLADLPHINVDRELEDGETVGDRLEGMINWDKVVEGLNLNDWVNIEYLGLISVRKIADELLDQEEQDNEDEVLR